MIRSEFVVTKARTDKAHTRDVIYRATGKKVGVITEPYGKGCGYKFHILTRNHASSKRYGTIKLAVLGMGDALWTSRTIVP